MIISTTKKEVWGKIELKLNDNISKTLHKLEEDVSQKDYTRQEKEYDLGLQILEMENSKYKDLIENFWAYYNFVIS